MHQPSAKPMPEAAMASAPSVRGDGARVGIGRRRQVRCRSAASPRSAEQVARKSRPRSSSKRCMRPRTSATKAAIRARISPMEPISSSSALLHVAPVHEPGLHARIVVEARGDVVLGDAGGDERARDLAAADGEAEFGARLRRFEAGARRKGRAAEDEIAVVIGEAEGAARRAGSASSNGRASSRRRSDGRRGLGGWCA